MMWKGRLLAISVVLASVLAGCSGPKSDSPASTPGTSNSNASLNKDDYPVFPNPDAGADPSVPADLGGKGFTGQGWETNTSFDLIGDPRAIKGGIFREYAPLAPGTYRMEGPEWNSMVNYAIANMMYEGLLT